VTPVSARLAFLDVGQGNCAVLYAGKSSIVFDCPPGSILPRFLRSRGIASVDHLVISHSDKDHSGGVRALIASGVDVRRLWILDDQLNETRHYHGIARAFADARSKGAGEMRRGVPHSDSETVNWGEYGIEWLAPNHEDRMLRGSRNSLSVVSRLCHSDVGLVLFPGDLDLAGYTALGANARDWRAEWLVAPHHGGLTGTQAETVEFLGMLRERTEAKYVLFSFARDNRWEYPRPGTVEKVRRLGASAVCTQLAKSCAEDLPTERRGSGLPAAGARGAGLSCCAGSLLLELRGGVVAWEGQEDHQGLVSGFLGARCAPQPAGAMEQMVR